MGVFIISSEYEEIRGTQSLINQVTSGWPPIHILTDNYATKAVIHMIFGMTLINQNIIVGSLIIHLLLTKEF